MGWLGLDDTDHLNGGCTTWAMQQVLQRLPDGAARVGDVRLVRLYPAAPHRTRGNAALAVEVDVTIEADAWREWLEGVWQDVVAPLAGQRSASHHSARPQAESDPGMVWYEQRPSSDFYQRAVRCAVDLQDVPKATWAKGGRGCIGAAAACAWEGKAGTWESIAWRKATSGARHVDQDMLAQLDEHPDLFACRDPRRGRGLVAPRGRSPVLFGIRGRTREAVTASTLSLLSAPGTEASLGSAVHWTNQGSGDHFEEVHKATVHATGIAKGGHVVLETSIGRMVAFQPSGPVAGLAASLREGDRIEALGLVIDGTIHLEALRHIDGPPRNKRRPTCPACKTRMKSAGSGQGLRCRTCAHRDVDRWIGDAVQPGPWTQPPLDRRRHLAPELAQTWPMHL